MAGATSEWKERAHQASRCMRGISHEIRLGILLSLKDGEKNVSALVKALGCSQPTLSQHLGIMRDRGILRGRKEGTQVLYAVANKRIYKMLDLMQELFCSKNVFLLIACLFSISTRGIAAEALSLARAKTLVVSAPRLSASLSEAHRSKNESLMTIGRFLPAVTISHGYMNTNDPVGAFSFKLQQKAFTQADFAVGSLNSPGPTGEWRTRLEVAQPIFHSLTDIENRRAMEHRREAADLRHEFNIQSARLQVSSLYFFAVAAGEKSRVIQDGVERLSKLEKGYQLMSAPTAATTTNYLIAQSIRLRMEAEREGLGSAKDGAEKDLTAAIGLADGSILELTDPLPPVPEKPEPAPSVVPERRDVSAGRAETEAARSIVRAAKSEWGPRLDAVGGYSLFTGNYSNLETSYDVGVMLTWPLFEGPRLWKADAAVDAEKSAESISRAVEAESKASSRKAESVFRAAVSQYRLIQEAEERASEALKISAKRYAEGSLPLFDYSQSIQNWVAARQMVIEIQRQAAEAKARIDFERGTL